MNSISFGHFLTALGRNSLQAALLVLAVLLVQWVSGKRLAPRWRCALWLLVVVRLLMPTSVGSPASLFGIWSSTIGWMKQEKPPFRWTLPDRITETPAQHAAENRYGSLTQTGNPQGASPLRTAHLSLSTPEQQAPDFVKAAQASPQGKLGLAEKMLPPSGMKHSSDLGTPMLSPSRVALTSTNLPPFVPWPSDINTAAASGFFNGTTILFVIWLSGTLTLLGHIGIASSRLARRCARLHPLTDPAVLTLLEQSCEQMEISRSKAASPLVIVECMEVRSPALHGLLRPKLLLPKGFTAKFSHVELKFVLLHELAHLKRRDLLINWVMALLQAVHWFNPLVWLAFARWRDDRELACDAMVLEAAGPEHNQKYGETILRLLEDFASPLRTPALVGILEEKRQLRQRIGMIAAYAPSPRWSSLAAVLIAGLTVIGLTDARSDNPTNNVSAPATSSESGLQLTLELRDGSRVIGKSLEDPLRFHSPSLGNLKLPVAGIKSIEFTEKGEGDTSIAKLTATNGDVLDLELVSPTLQIQTGFGKSEVPVNMIRSLKISVTGGEAMSTLTNNLLSYWNFNCNNPNFFPPDGGQLTYPLQTGSDGRGPVNPGTVVPGKIEKAIEFGDGGNEGLYIPTGDFPILTTFTITAWVKLNYSVNTTSDRSLIACSWDGGDGFNFQMSVLNGYLLGAVGIGGTQYGPQTIAVDKQVDFRDMQWHFCIFQSQDNSYIRVKVDDKDWATLPILGSLSGASSRPFQVGQDRAQSHFNANCIIDMLGVWNRVLSDDELAQLYNGGAGLEYPFVRSTSHTSNPAATSQSTIDNPLTVELRDGSRVIGKSLDDPLRFHSPSLGDLRLPISGIKSIEFTGNGDDANIAKLSATNGDVLDVQFVAPTLHVQTAFGKSEVPVKMIRSLKLAGSPPGDEGSQPVYDAKADFSSSQNPSGAWTYGWSSELGGDLHVYSDAFLTASSQCWSDPSILSLGAPHVSYNNHDETIDSIPGRAMSMHPGPQNQFSHCRCTIAMAGVYNIQASFTALSSGGPHVYILHNGTPLGDSLLTQGIPWNFSANTVTLQTGDTIDAVIGVGQDNSFQNDATQFSLTICKSSQTIAQSPKPSSGPANPKETNSQLTVELRDGSRVIGKSLDDPLKLHSPSLGDLKLPVAGIKSIEFTGSGDDANIARLTATNGDVLDVQFVAATLPIQTGFGKSEVPINLISMIKLTNPAGLQSVNLSSLIQNPSFETPDVTGPNPYFSYSTDPTDTGWTFVNSAGVAKNGSGMAFYKSGTSYGTQFAWLQGLHGVGASMSQTISNLRAGTYAFKFIASQRDQIGRDNSQNQTVTVLVDGTSVGSFTPPDINWQDFQTTPVFLTTGDHTLTFTNLPVPGDAMILVDNVSIEEVDATDTKPVGPITVASPKETRSQLTLELRDGSRVIGKILDDPLKFHSPSLGDLKLPVAGIKSIEFVGNGNENENQVRLTATNGDVLDVQFVAPTIHLQTGFGKSEVPVKMIRKIKGSSTRGDLGLTSEFPHGLVALWSGDGNGEDSAGTNNAIVPTGVTYASAGSGEGFQFDGHSEGLSIPTSSSLNVGKGDGLTLACWINPTSVATPQPLIEWRGDPNGINWNLHWGVHFWISDLPGNIPSPGNLYANIIGTDGNVHIFSTPPGTVQVGVFQFVTLTYDKASGQAKLYYNGSLVTSSYLGSFIPKTDTTMLIGERLDGGEFRYEGIMDDIFVFNRALTMDEIQKIYAAQARNQSVIMALPKAQPSVPQSQNGGADPFGPIRKTIFRSMEDADTLLQKTSE